MPHAAGGGRGVLRSTFRMTGGAVWTSLHGSCMRCPEGSPRPRCDSHGKTAGPSGYLEEDDGSRPTRPDNLTRPLYQDEVLAMAARTMSSERPAGTGSVSVTPTAFLYDLFLPGDKIARSAAEGAPCVAHDVFISYSTTDQPVADAACAHLEAAGVKCWIATKRIQGGDDWSDEIIDGIRNARAIVVIFSARADGSKHVKREVAFGADTCDLPVIPFRVEDVRADEAGVLPPGVALDQRLPRAERTLRQVGGSGEAEAGGAGGRGAAGPRRRAGDGNAAVFAPAGRHAGYAGSGGEAGGGGRGGAAGLGVLRRPAHRRRVPRGRRPARRHRAGQRRPADGQNLAARPRPPAGPQGRGERRHDGLPEIHARAAQDAAGVLRRRWGSFWPTSSIWT